MLRRLFVFAAVLLCLVDVGVMCPVHSQPAPDSLTIDTTQLGLKGAQPLDGEYAPQTPPRDLNQAKPDDVRWKQLTSSDAYSYRTLIEGRRPKEQPRDDSRLVKIVEGFFRFLGSGVGRVLLWAVFLLVIGAVLWRIIRGQGNALFARRNRCVAAPEDADSQLSTEHLSASDWEMQMRQALQEGAHRAAIRFGYLRVLQLLHERSMIAYRPDKTNREYARELQGDLAAEFRTLTRLYEWAWYGGVLPGQQGIDDFLSGFQKIKQSIGAA